MGSSFYCIRSRHVNLKAMEIRPYQPSQDLAGCLAVFDSNGGDAAARQAFADFLASGAKVFVMEHDGAIIGCGGFTVQQDQVARLHYGMIRKDLQRQGLGRFLLLYRLKEIGKHPDVVFVEAAVPPHLSRLYERNGLKPAGGGIHRMKLQVCTAG